MRWQMVCFGIIFLVSCQNAGKESIKLVKNIRLDKRENAKSPQRLLIKNITSTDKNMGTLYSIRLEIQANEEILESFQESQVQFLSAEEVPLEKGAYFVSCEYTNSSWGAKKSIIIWSENGNWHILPLHFKRASLYLKNNRFLIDERMSNRNEKKSERELYEFKSGLLSKYFE